MLDLMKGSGKGLKVGVLTKDLKFPGSFMDGWRAYWDKHGKVVVEHVDMTNALTCVMAPKEEGEIATIKKAAGVSLPFELFLWYHVLR